MKGELAALRQCSRTLQARQRQSLLSIGEDTVESEISRMEAGGHKLLARVARPPPADGGAYGCPLGAAGMRTLACPGVVKSFVSHAPASSVCVLQG